MEREPAMRTEEEMFGSVLIRLEGIPRSAAQPDLEEFVSSITQGSVIHPTIGFPAPRSVHISRSGTDGSIHGLIRFDWAVGRSEDEADTAFTAIMEACHRLKLAGLCLPAPVPTPTIEPILLCPTTPICLPDPAPVGPRQSLVFQSFLPHIRLADHRPPRHKNRRFAGPSNRLPFIKKSINFRHDSPKDYSQHDEQLSDIQFVRNKHRIAKQKKQDYLAAEKLLKHRTMSQADRMRL